jgi:sugar/nucleoside kinase (ribokinase family)
VGLATVDMLCVAPRVELRLVEMSVFSMQGGGSAANILSVLANFGVRGRYFGRVGDDDFGRFIRRSLQQLHIDDSMLLVEKGKVSPVSFIQIDEVSRRRKVLISRGNVKPLTTRDLPDQLLDGARLLCIDGSQPAVQAVVAERARAKGVTVLLNASQLSGGMGELLSLSDIVVGSERFANELAPSDELADSLREIIRRRGSAGRQQAGPAGRHRHLRGGHHRRGRCVLWSVCLCSTPGVAARTRPALCQRLRRSGLPQPGLALGPGHGQGNPGRGQARLINAEDRSGLHPPVRMM